MPEKLHPFHPMRVLQDWSALSPGAAFRIADAVTGVSVFGATGSGKTSGPAKHLASAYLSQGSAAVYFARNRRSAASGSVGPPKTADYTTCAM